MHFLCEATALCPDSMNEEVPSKPEIWTFPRCGSCAVDWWQLLEHDPRCHPAHTWGLCWQGTVLWAEGAHLWELRVDRVPQGEPQCSSMSLWRSRSPEKSLSSSPTICVTHVLLCKCWDQGCWLPGSSCLQFMANNSCNVQLPRALSPADRGALTGLLRGHSGVWQSPTGCRAPPLPRLSLPRSKQCLPSWECHSRKQQLLSDACGHGSRFHAGCFPKREQLEYFCYISLHK